MNNIADAMAAYAQGNQSAAHVLVPVITRLAKVVAWNNNRKELADDVAQQFWLEAIQMLGSYDPEKGPPEPYLMGCLRNITLTMSRKNPIPVEDIEGQEDIYESMAANACAEEILDRKLAVDAIQKRMGLAVNNSHLSPLPFVRAQQKDSAREEAALPGPLLPQEKKPKAKNRKGADHLRIREIRLRLDMTQGEYADRLGLVPVTLVSYERGNTKKVPPEVMERAEELMLREGEVLEWRKKFDARSMVDILAQWAKELGADPSDLPTMAALTGTVTSTISRWRNGECRPTLREIVAYDRNVKMNAARLRKSGLLIETQIVREAIT